MAETRADEVQINRETVPAQRVQAMWREQNAAFRARVLQQLRQTRDESAPRTA